MRVVVLVCANSEWRAVKEIIKPGEVEATPVGESFRGRAGRHEVLYLHGGWGKIAAAGSTQFAIDRWRPEMVVNLGTCGGFEGRIERGTILLATKTIVYDIVEQMGDPEEAIADYTTEMDVTWTEGIEGGKMPVVREVLVSADRDLLAEDIPMLVEKYGARAVDWESGAIAWTAKRNGARCLILRGVSDLVSEAGGEAYGKIEVFHERTREVMGELIKQLPVWLDAAMRM